MPRIVELPPPVKGLRSDGLYPGGWWHESEGEAGRIVCDLCPRECHLKPGDRGFCFVRQNVDGEMMLTTYGRSTGFCIDPIEKKPLNHFLPGTSVLSFGTAGCNLGCKFCQNWDISKSREVERLSEEATPEAIAQAALHYHCRSVAYTYNDPVIWAEYAIDCAKACRAVGVKNVAVTAGYISPAARGPFYEFMDAANVDLKAFTEDFYYKITYSHLQPVLDTIEWLKRETSVWFELTNLVIPQANDSMEEIRQMCDWILQHVGDDVPVHFTAFHPDFRMRDRGPTPPETLIQAREVARQQGLKFVYVGNVHDETHQSTYCPACQGLLIQRDWYELGAYHLRGNHCGHCGAQIAGVFEAAPGTWGRKRLPVRIAEFAHPLPVIEMPTIKTKEEPEAMANTAQTEGTAARLQAQRPKLTEEQQQLILRAACEIISAAILKRAGTLADPTLAGAAEKTVMGAFVTLKRQGRLRACCGALGRPMPLGTALAQAAVRTATEDARLPTIAPRELPFLDVDVSLLYGFRKLDEPGSKRADAIEVGKHGLQIQHGSNAGLLLPSVATEHGYHAKQFLTQLCRKAGLPDTAWQDEEAVVQTFEAVTIDGAFEPDCCRDLTEPPPLLAETELRALAAHCGANLAALVQGATPSYYVPGVSDGSVNGLTLTLKPEAVADAIHFFRLSLRPSMPLQSTCYSLCEAVAQAITSGALQLPSGNVSVALSLLHDPAMHGTVAHVDLRGVDPRRHALLIVEGSKSTWMFDPARSTEKLFQMAREQANVFQPEAAAVYSLTVETTEPSIAVTNAPKAVATGGTRPPAVAGRFYPADADELNEMVDRFLGERPGKRKKLPAVMVPHAGLVYSGKVAGEVFSRIKIPDTVIVIGPKHTRLGVEWAVAPHDTWQIPGREIHSDPELARRLVEAIPGLQLDAAAHQMEHGIEVELPFLAKLNPGAKVVGIVVGGGDLARCREFAGGLARTLRELPDEVLLVISSDMNHYATDEENRRLDEMAMQAMESLDAERLLQTCQEHRISMCGVLPAVIVMETLKQWKGLERAERVAYATSADVSGDTSRVVGYCGMLLS